MVKMDWMTDEPERTYRAVGAQQQPQLAKTNIRASTHVPVHRAVCLASNKGLNFTKTGDRKQLLLMAFVK